ncbi:biotin synthase BioB [Sporosarcina sp. P19]|uniref:biotin synthase BioB n=1 Tax=Sporosarcina sp. P19 TaxID=2048258 RepID=UPI000C162BB9|nr:biotin synthase BioB [Sporosarcina sp. P19]
MNYQRLATQVLEGHEVTDEESLAILNSPDEDLLLLLHATYSIRSHYFGNKVKLNMIINTKSGLCPENCGYCAQSIISKAPVEKYAMMKSEEILEGAERAAANKAGTYCIVASGRGPRDSELDIVIDSVKQIKEKHKGMTVCACLGILKPGQATRLKEAGVDRYNHNLNTSAEHHESITTSHTYDDRVNTVGLAKEAGISPCSGVIVGMRETKQDIISMARSLRELDADSIPVNFLHAVDGTPLEGTSELDPRYCIKVLCLFRYINPSKEIRISGGREVNLRSLQPLGLYAANSIFIGDYLTTAGQENDQDQKMLEDMGFVVDLEPLRKEPITI